MYAAALTSLDALARSAKGLLDAGESPEWTMGIIAYVLNERAMDERSMSLIVASAATFIADPTRKLRG